MLTTRTTQFINEIINESAKIANLFNSYFESVTESLDLLNWVPEPYDKVKGSVERILQRFSHQLNIITIKQNFKILANFSFTQVTIETVKNIINGLPQNKWLSRDILISRSSEFTIKYLIEGINKVLGNSKLRDPLNLKRTPQIYLIFDQLAFCLYFQKPFEKVIPDQLCNYMNKFLNSLLCRFRMAYLDCSKLAEKGLINVGVLALYL